MDREYVQNLSMPNVNKEFVHKKAEELIVDHTFSSDTIEYAIDNFLQAAGAYYDDFDPQKLYYKVKLIGKTRNICFDIENLAHLLGLPNSKYLLQATIINDRLSTRVNSKNWLNVFKELFLNDKEDIVAFDSNPDNSEEQKLNWDKIAEKVFCFLNIGILSEGETLHYRHDISLDKVKDYVLTRDVISNGINGQIRMQVTIQKLGNEEILVPTSIIFVEKPPKVKKIKMLDKEYQFAGKATIFQFMGGNYGK